MQLVEDDCELFPGISVRMFDGHTPGQMIPFISSGERTYVYMADLIPTAANIPIVWLAAYDLHPVTAMEEKVYRRCTPIADRQNKLMVVKRKMDCFLKHSSIIPLFTSNSVSESISCFNNEPCV